MDKKLTLSLNDKVIEQAKIYAKSHKTSLSRLIETYLNSLTNREITKNKPSHLVESISGKITLDDDFDYKSEIADYLIKKYK